MSNPFFQALEGLPHFCQFHIVLKIIAGHGILDTLGDLLDVLIVLWILATIQNLSYLSVVICFGMFLVNDLYGFWNWQKMGRRQSKKI